MYSTDTEVGEYYHYEYGQGIYHIGQVQSGHTLKGIDCANRDYYDNGVFNNAFNIRPATGEEIEWLDRCIEAGEFLPQYGD